MTVIVSGVAIAWHSSSPDGASEKPRTAVPPFCATRQTDSLSASTAAKIDTVPAGLSAGKLERWLTDEGWAVRSGDLVRSGSLTLFGRERSSWRRHLASCRCADAEESGAGPGGMGSTPDPAASA